MAKKKFMQLDLEYYIQKRNNQEASQNISVKFNLTEEGSGAK